jgi:hypothetical protein
MSSPVVRSMRPETAHRSRAGSSRRLENRSSPDRDPAGPRPRLGFLPEIVTLTRYCSFDDVTDVVGFVCARLVQC